jgi:C4-dicarboxylate-specific signal transduction histidine kinase
MPSRRLSLSLTGTLLMGDAASAANGDARVSLLQKLGVGLALLVLALLILEVVVEHVRRRRAEIDARQNQAAVVHMNRVEVFGELAGALAHEVNTPLAAIMNDARATRHFLEGSTPALPDALECIDAIEINAQRAHEVIARMRNALRREDSARSLQDLSSIVRDSVRLLEHEARHRGAEFELLLARQPLQVEGDAVQLQQVLLNLLLNALDASTEQPAARRRVFVRTQASGGLAEATVRDRGCGVPAEVRARLFEPFYTTKPTGLGMGLAISRSIAVSHGGRILMEPAEEVGAVFRLILPLAGQTAVARREDA